MEIEVGLVSKLSLELIVVSLYEIPNIDINPLLLAV